jgi:hypothetical protein
MLENNGMVISPLSITPDYWESFSLTEEDLDFLYNHLLEIEIPLTSEEMIAILVDHRVKFEKENLKKGLPNGGKLYLPKDHYQIGEVITFPAMNWSKGKVLAIRPGNNPEYGAFEVIEVEFERAQRMNFAAGIAEHALNQPIEINMDDPLLAPQAVIKRYGPRLVQLLRQALEANEDLVRIAGRWFPRALLVDVNVGHLNLAEAVLDMACGGPLRTPEIMEQIDLPTDVNTKLTEFSMNLALQEDGRFDEIGPTGETVWFLKRLEPDALQNPPIYLRSNAPETDVSVLNADTLALEREIDDELTGLASPENGEDEIVIPLLYPHWRVGSLPLSERVCHFFPTAVESPRIQFALVDGDSGTKYSGWVVRPYHFIYGLRDWYVSMGLIPGSLVHIQHSNNPGEVIVRVEKRRSSKDWIRTVLVGADGGIVYAMLKQLVTSTFDERMATAIPDVNALDKVWEGPTRQRATFENVVISSMRELAKLNPQGHVHTQELYAAVNIVRRSPPRPIFTLLATHPAFIHVGDQYYRLNETYGEERPE